MRELLLGLRLLLGSGRGNRVRFLLMAGGSAVGELRITVHSRFPDVLVTILTAGLLVPRSVTFEGVVVK